MKYFLLLPLLALSALTAADHARGVYVGGAAAYIENESLVSPTANEDKINWPAFELVAGYKYNGWLGVDVRYGFSQTEKDLATIISGDNPNPGRIEYAMDGYQSIYYRPELINTEAKIYLLLGYSKVDSSVTSYEDVEGTETDQGTEDFSESGTSYGLGIGWFVNDKVNVNIEYRELLDKDDAEFSVLTLGADYRFSF